jgi:dnd system-associated protein 4
LTRLTEPNSRGERVFETKQKGLMFAAAFGFTLQRRLPIDVKAPGIRYDVFEGAFDDSFIDALAVAVMGDLAVLSEERSDERVDIFEEYAHGGLEEMRRVCFEQVGDPLDNLIRLTTTTRTPNSEIPGIDPSVLDGLLSR